MMAIKAFWQIAISIITAVIIAVSTMYMTFATKAEVTKMVDDKHQGVMYMFNQVMDKLDKIDQRVWELQKNKK